MFQRGIVELYITPALFAFTIRAGSAALTAAVGPPVAKLLARNRKIDMLANNFQERYHFLLAST